MKELVFRLENTNEYDDTRSRKENESLVTIVSSSDFNFSYLVGKDTKKWTLDDLVFAISRSDDDSDFINSVRVDKIITIDGERSKRDHPRLWVVVKPSDIYPPYLALPHDMPPEAIPTVYREKRFKRLESCRIAMTNKIEHYLRNKYGVFAIGVKITFDPRYML